MTSTVEPPALNHPVPDFSDHFRKNGRDLLSYFVRRLAVPADAGDLLSETFLVAWRKRKTAPSDQSQIRPWLFGIARKVLSQQRRAARRRDALADRLGIMIEAQHLAVGVFLPDGDDGLAAHVRDLVACLQPIDREIICLVYWEGFTQEEVAQIIGKPPATVRSRMARARNHLRSQLAESGDISE